MSRPQRIEYANAFYHVMNRGAGRRSIFNNDHERMLFLAVLSDAHVQFKVEDAEIIPEKLQCILQKTYGITD